MRAVEIGPRPAQVEIDWRSDAGVLVHVVFRPAEGVRVGDEQAVDETAVDLDLQAVVLRLVLVAANARRPGAVVGGELRPADVARSVDEARVLVDVHHQIHAAVADVGEVGRQMEGELPLERDVPGVQGPFAQAVRDDVVSRIQERSRDGDDAVLRDVHERWRREAGSHRSRGREPVRHRSRVVLLDRVVERIPVIGERNRPGTISRADHCPVVEAPGHAGARVEVRERVLDIDGFAGGSVAGNAQRVGGWVVVREAARTLEASER